jgi:HK97 family phage major capsid protein
MSAANANNTTAKPTATSQIVDAVEKLSKSQEALGDKLANLEKNIGDLSKAQYPYGIPGGAPAIRKGEDPLSSRPYSLMRLATALHKKAAHESDWNSGAKVELELSQELHKAYSGYSNVNPGSVLIPLGSELMPAGDTELADGGVAPGIDGSLIRKCRSLMSNSMSGFDPDEFAWLAKRGAIALRKDLSSQTGTAGGTLVGLATQGELIEYLRGVEVFSQAGATQIDLPPQGRIRFPRQNGTVTIAATTEGATVSESTPSTGALELSAKPYSGLVDIPDELLRFSTSTAVEAWLRTEFLRELALQLDKDMFNGGGGSKIQGVLFYSGLQSHTASTVGSNGNTLGPADPTLLYAKIADQNAPVDRGFFYAMTNTLWAGLSTRRADAVTGGDGAGPFMFNTFTGQMLTGSGTNLALNGHKVICSTQVPRDRVKGAGTDLTMVLGGVGSEWVIARAGVAEIVMTNSDGTKFQNRVSTMRGTIYADAGPRHEQSFGVIDTLLNA